MFETILLPLDGSKQSERALPVALEVAKRFRAAIVLVHVVEPARYFTQIAGLENPQAVEMALEQAQRQDRASITRGRNYVARMREQIHEEGIRATSHVLMGPVAKTLLKLIGDHDADLVVMTTRGRSGVRRAVLGSVADEMVRTATCPVLLVGPTRGE